MDMDVLPPDLRQRLRTAFDNLANLLDEETGRLARADAEELKLYTEAKYALFEQLGILLKEANRPVLPPPPPAAEIVPDVAVITDVPPATAEPADSQAAGAEPAEADTGSVEPEPMDDPAAVRAAAARLRGAVETNARAIRAAQEAVSTVARHIARAVEQSRSDGVYGRSGQSRRSGNGSFARIEREL